MSDELRQDLIIIRVGGGTMPDYLLHADVRLAMTRKGDISLSSITIVNLMELHCKGDARLINQKVSRIADTIQRQLDQVPHNVLPLKVVFDVSEATLYKTPKLEAKTKKYIVTNGGDFNKTYDDKGAFKISRNLLFQSVKPYLSIDPGNTGLPVFRVAQFDLTADLQKAMSTIGLLPPRPSDDEYAFMAETKDQAISLVAFLAILIGVENCGSASYLSPQIRQPAATGLKRKIPLPGIGSGAIDYPTNNYL